jgi:hypothetical protein
MSIHARFHGRHNGVGNVLWCDGHAKAFKPALRDSSLPGPYNAAQLATLRASNIGEIVPGSLAGKTAKELDLHYDLD